MAHQVKDSVQKVHKTTITNNWLYRRILQTRIWWIEVLRGLFTLAFGILYLSLQNLVYALIYILGAYLLGDGLLDLYRLIGGKRASQHSVSLYLGTSISIIIGLISLLAPVATLFLSGVFIAFMISWRGIQVTRSENNGNIWQRAYGIVLIACGLTLFLPPLLSLTTRVLTIFVGIYACGDGLFLLVRGLRLWAAPSTFTALIHRATRAQLDIPRRLPRTTRRAIIFVRHSGAAGLGHVSWAFEWRNGWFNAGGVENRHSHAIAQPENADFWTAHTTDPIATMQKFGQHYDEYKIFYVTQPHPKMAWRTVVWLSRIAYTVIRHNCVDATYDVLRTYGVADLPDPAMQYAPNDWYDSLPGSSYAIALNPTIPLHIKRQARHKLARTETLLTIPAHVVGTPPPWREQGVRGLAEIALTWRRMVSDVRAICVSLAKFIAGRIRPSSPLR